MRVFVTVGSTRFDALVQQALSAGVIDVLRARGYSTLVVQCGNSDFDRAQFVQEGPDGDADAYWVRQLEGVGRVEIWKFKPSLKNEYERADLVISHAGSGTILDVLRLHKPLIVVPNPTLLDNHQEELADALAGLGHVKTSTVSSLADTIQKLDLSTIVPFPVFNGSRFRELLDEEMGYVPAPTVS